MTMSRHPGASTNDSDYNTNATAMSNSFFISDSASGSLNSRSNGNTQDSFSCSTAGRAQRRRLFELYESGVLTDVTLIVQGECIAAHRIILATASPFFHALFTSGMKESREHEIILHEVNVVALRELLEYMYLGELQITGDTILAILHTANQLEMLDVVEICCKQLILELNVSNCVDIYVCCESLKTCAPCSTLAHAALAMIETFLCDVMESDAFLQLPLALVAQILLRQQQQQHQQQEPQMQQTDACHVALQAWIAFDPAVRNVQVQEIQGSTVSCGGRGDHQLDPYPIIGTGSLASSLKTPVIFAIGGFNGPSALRSVEYLDFHTNEWYAVASMHERRSYIGVVATDDNQILVLGGSCSSRHLKTVEKFDPERNAWTMMPPMRKGRSYLGAALLDGYVYCVGGFNGMAHLAAVERFHLQSHHWEEVAPLQTGRSGLAVVVVDGELYAIGGYDGRRHLKSVEVYDAQRNTWATLPGTMLHARNGPAAVASLSDKSILVVGGESRHGFRMNSSERLDLSRRMDTTTGIGASFGQPHPQHWQEVGPFVDCRSGHVAVAMLRDSFVFALGGSNKKDEYLDDVHRFDPLTKTWMPHSRMIHQRCGLNVAVVRVSRNAACLHHSTKANPTAKYQQRVNGDGDGTTVTSPSGVDNVAPFASLYRRPSFTTSSARAPFS